MESRAPAYLQALGWVQADIDALIAAGNRMRSAIAANTVAQAAAQASRQAKDAAVKTYTDAVRPRVRRAKEAMGYTPAIGEDLQIIGPEAEVDYNRYSPEISAQTFPGYVEIRFRKGPGIDGVNIYTRTAGTQPWTRLAYDSQSPYTDNRPLSAPAVPKPASTPPLACAAMMRLAR